ncbi:MAG: hypothetical protein SOR93_12525 [Clostridiales Family XIII bacterium]|nr:hypothetical protein [Clostridia bacterium]MDY3012059.1 hypothetical protein [Clostridiales Family XIII bacterium]
MGGLALCLLLIIPSAACAEDSPESKDDVMGRFTNLTQEQEKNSTDPA